MHIYIYLVLLYSNVWYKYTSMCVCVCVYVTRLTISLQYIYISIRDNSEYYIYTRNDQDHSIEAISPSVNHDIINILSIWHFPQQSYSNFGGTTKAGSRWQLRLVQGWLQFTSPPGVSHVACHAVAHAVFLPWHRQTILCCRAYWDKNLLFFNVQWWDVLSSLEMVDIASEKGSLSLEWLVCFLLAPLTLHLLEVRRLLFRLLKLGLEADWLIVNGQWKTMHRNKTRGST